MRIRIGNMTIDTTDNDDTGNAGQNAAQIEGGVITGGHFGGENHGIVGGTFHGTITGLDDDR
ncbi:hypothetical protein [Streptomyces sp. NPDC001108]